MKICGKCGEMKSRDAFYKHTRKKDGLQTRCKCCQKEDMRVRMRRRKIECIELLGGRCVRCGTDEKLEFDHVKPRSQSFRIARTYVRGREKLESELKKCQLLCWSCHLVKSRETGELPPAAEHGNRSRYANQGCRCALCSDASARYWRERRARALAVANRSI